MPCPLTNTHIFTHTLTHKPTHTHTLPHRHINIHNYNLISGHELQRRSLQTDQLTDRMVPLLSPPPTTPTPHNATVALPLLLSLFRLLAACECRCGCRFLSPINFLLIRSLFLHTLSHTRTAVVHAQQIMQSSNTHTRSYMLL